MSYINPNYSILLTCYSCPKCGIDIWINSGDIMDITSFYDDTIKCPACKHLFYVCDDNIFTFAKDKPGDSEIATGYLTATEALCAQQENH